MPRLRHKFLQSVSGAERYAECAVSSMSDRNLTNGLAGWGFLAALAAAPVLFGGNTPLAWGINAVLIGGVLLMHSAGHLVSGRPFAVPAAWVAFPLAAFAAVSLWAFLQSVSWTPASWHHPIWRSAALALGEPAGGGNISVNPGETRLALLRLLTAGACFWLALQLGRDPLWARRIVLAIAVSGAAYALYGLVLKAAKSETVLWLTKTSHEFAGVVTGPFINPNSFAIYIGIASLCALGLFAHAVRLGLGDHGLTGARQWAARSLYLGRAVGVHAILLLPLLTSLVLSGSRAGFLLTLCAALVMLALGQRRSSLSLWPALLILSLAALGGAFVLASHGDYLGKELAETRVSDLSSRLAIGGIVLRAVADAPLLGFGYGAFADVFPIYRDGSVALFGQYLEAHNSYLEALLGLGIPAAGLLFAVLGYLVFRCFVGAVTRRRDHLAPAVAAAASVVIGVHALIDFSIQLQGIAIIYAALLGAGCAQSWSSLKGRGNSGGKALQPC